jgi:predicted outer membrane protein
MRMRRWLWSAGLLATLGVGAGCAHSEAQQARSQGERVGEAVSKKVRFVDQLSLLNQQQIVLSKLALEKSTNPEVRRFAQEMLQNHQRNEADLEALARSKTLALSELDENWEQQGLGGAGFEGAQKGVEKGQSGYDKQYDQRVDEFLVKREQLEGLSGPAFDKAFLDQVRKDQKRGGKLVDQGLDDYRDDAALAVFLGRTAPVFNSHEQQAESLRQSVGR